MEVPFAAPEIGPEEMEEVTAVIRSGWLTTASRATQLEKQFRDYIGARFSMAVNSGTAALHLSLEALGVGHGDSVIVPVMTFTATAEVVRYVGADPLFVDCDKETFCISSDTIEKRVREVGGGLRPSLIRAVMPVHFGGHPCDMDGIMDLARAHGIRVVEDAAHALPTRYQSKGTDGSEDRGRLIGALGDVTCFSFYANKTMTTGEGGMLCTESERIAKRIAIMRLHGIDRDVWDRYSTGASWEYDVVAPGFKYNMPDLNAAIGLHQLKKVEEFRDWRQRIAERYYQDLSGIPGLILPRLKCAMASHSWHLFVVLIDPRETPANIDRDGFIDRMAEYGIGTSVHYKPLHRMTYYRRKYRLSPEMFPNAEWIYRRCVSLPIYSAMSDVQLDYVISRIQHILG